MIYKTRSVEQELLLKARKESISTSRGLDALPANPGRDLSGSYEAKCRQTVSGRRLIWPFKRQCCASKDKIVVAADSHFHYESSGRRR